MPSEVVSREVEPPTSKGRVLVIDDEPAIRESLHALLTLEGGYTVDLAEGGTEGLQKLARRGYDLVLLDLMMPDMSGMEVLHEVRERDRETPIFMITAYGSVQAAVDALKAGADDYFPKPFENDKLIREIEGVIARRRLEHENTHLKRALKQRYSFPNIIGKSEQDAARARPGGAGGAQPRHDSDHRRDRHRQGTDRQGDSRQFAALRFPVRGGEQRLAAAGPAGIHAVRPRQGRLHQRGAHQEGLLRGGQPGHDFLRRDRHDRRWKRRPSCCA